MPARNTLVQPLTLYTDPESHNTQRYRQTDGQKDDTIMLTRSSATAEKQRVSCPHGGGQALQLTTLRPLWLHLCVWSNPKATTYTYAKRAVRKAHFKMNRAFKVIQGHPCQCRQESTMVCCRNVQLMPTLFLKLTKIWQRENGKFVDFNDLTHV